MLHTKLLISLTICNLQCYLLLGYGNMLKYCFFTIFGANECLQLPLLTKRVFVLFLLLTQFVDFFSCNKSSTTFILCNNKPVTTKQQRFMEVVEDHPSLVTLPFELKLVIFSYLDVNSVLSLSSLSHDFNSSTTCDEFYQYVVEKDCILLRLSSFRGDFVTYLSHHLNHASWKMVQLI